MLPEVRVLKYRRPDSGVTRVWAGSKRRHILNVLLGAERPMSGLAVAETAGCSYGAVSSLLRHLELARWAEITGSPGGIKGWELTAAGREAIDNFVLGFTSPDEK